MSKQSKKSIEFQCFAAEAQEVFLAGTFNDWQPNATPMKKDDDGIWSIKLKLSQGHHEYKFVVDGEWCCLALDQQSHDCPNCVPNELGSLNQFVDV
ncbi:glycogen-binding domain-containing protein [Thalassoglobus sp.]|uniref:glycogen-binding domain-containing protein n=1 Tax=Thalassoglobus sp. TaxID=2795869 RepID=UPI003AA9123E